MAAMPLGSDELRRRVALCVTPIVTDAGIRELVVDAVAAALWATISSSQRNDAALQALREDLDSDFPEVAAALKFRYSGTSETW